MKRILIVDDEPTLLNLLKRYLERQGLTADTAHSPEEALALFRAAPAEYGVVVSDLTLEGMNGEQLIGEMRKLAPGLPGLVASGYPYEPQLKGVAFLQKPFLPQMLSDAVAKAMKK